MRYFASMADKVRGSATIKFYGLVASMLVTLMVIASQMGIVATPWPAFVSMLICFMLAGLIVFGRDAVLRIAYEKFLIIKNNPAFAVRYSLLMSIVFLAHHSSSIPDDPDIRKVLQVFEILWCLLLLSLPLWLGYKAVKVSITGKGVNLTPYLDPLIVGVAVFSAIKWFVAANGEGIKAQMINNPLDALITAAAFFLFVALVGITKLIALPSVNIVAQDLTPPMNYGRLGSTGFFATERDLATAAAHEAGHALVYALISNLPKDFEVVINKELDISGSVGHVSGVASGHKLTEKTFAEWNMLVLLAGKYAESFGLGLNTMGSESDHLKWMVIARGYLANHFEGIFYNEPQNRFEQELNEEKFSSLQAKQLGMLEQLFNQNEEVFKELSGTLLAHKRLGHAEVKPLLAKVIVPAGLPRPMIDSLAD